MGDRVDDDGAPSRRIPVLDDAPPPPAPDPEAWIPPGSSARSGNPEDGNEDSSDGSGSIGSVLGMDSSNAFPSGFSVLGVSSVFDHSISSSSEMPADLGASGSDSVPSSEVSASGSKSTPSTAEISTDPASGTTIVSSSSEISAIPAAGSKIVSPSGEISGHPASGSKSDPSTGEISRDRRWFDSYPSASARRELLGSGASGGSNPSSSRSDSSEISSLEADPSSIRHEATIPSSSAGENPCSPSIPVRKSDLSSSSSSSMAIPITSSEISTDLPSSSSTTGGGGNNPSSAMADPRQSTAMASDGGSGGEIVLLGGDPPAPITAAANPPAAWLPWLGADPSGAGSSSPPSTGVRLPPSSSTPSRSNRSGKSQRTVRAGQRSPSSSPSGLSAAGRSGGEISIPGGGSSSSTVPDPSLPIEAGASAIPIGYDEPKPASNPFDPGPVTESELEPSSSEDPSSSAEPKAIPLFHPGPTGLAVGYDEGEEQHAAGGSTDPGSSSSVSLDTQLEWAVLDQIPETDRSMQELFDEAVREGSKLRDSIDPGASSSSGAPPRSFDPGASSSSGAPPRSFDPGASSSGGAPPRSFDPGASSSAAQWNPVPEEVRRSFLGEFFEDGVYPRMEALDRLEGRAQTWREEYEAARAMNAAKAGGGGGGGGAGTISGGGAGTIGGGGGAGTIGGGDGVGTIGSGGAGGGGGVGTIGGGGAGGGGGDPGGGNVGDIAPPQDQNCCASCYHCCGDLVTAAIDYVFNCC